jgi:hypothetical protein
MGAFTLRLIVYPFPGVKATKADLPMAGRDRGEKADTAIEN